MNNLRLYQLALKLVPNVGDVRAKLLVDHFGDAESIFKATKRQLNAIEGLGEVAANSIKHFQDFELAEKELEFADKHKIQVLFLKDEAYPKRLLHCYDAPTILFYRGNANLNADKVVSIVGTRNNTDYGEQVTNQVVEELASLNVLIVSGLAFGIDAIAHKAALRNGLHTVGALGHGLNTIYPSQHRGLAKDMVTNGGLITEFTHGTDPDKHNFPRRNRLVAGMADVTIIVETAAKGGSMITAEMAFSYNRDLFAVPGKITDGKSAGSNKLIQQNKAILLSDVDQLISTMGWQNKKKSPKKQRELFVELSEEENTIMKVFADKEAVHIDQLYYGHGLSASTVATAILNLELHGIIKSLPGKMYSLT